MKSFTVENVLSWGLENDTKYGGYRLPVSFKNEAIIIKTIQKIVDKHNTNQVFYGESKTIYFKLYELTKRQSEELLDKGRQFIDLRFVVDETPIESKNGNLYLRMTITGLRKSKKTFDNAPEDEF